MTTSIIGSNVIFTWWHIIPLTDRSLLPGTGAFKAGEMLTVPTLYIPIPNRHQDDPLTEGWSVFLTFCKLHSRRQQRPTDAPCPRPPPSLPRAEASSRRGARVPSKITIPSKTHRPGALGTSAVGGPPVCFRLSFLEKFSLCSN